jgi:D-aminoacyl-tRNA deacylase
MRLLIQRVKEAKVVVNEQICGQISTGLLVFLGVHKNDTPDKVAPLVNKLIGLRIFSDKDGKMNLDVKQVNGSILVVSQFTLYANCQSGKRPEFTESALPEPAFLLYEQFIQEATQELGKAVQTGIFGALMEVSLINDGPVTLFLER